MATSTTGAECGGGARLSAIAVVGGVEIVVDEGIRITIDGFSLLGSRHGRIGPASGPALHIRASAIFGAVEVTSTTDWSPSAVSESVGCESRRPRGNVG